MTAPAAVKPVAKTAPDNLETALAIAARGVRVFPCAGRAAKTPKAPLTEHGFGDATSDPELIRAWWRRSPAALIGIPYLQLDAIGIDIDQHPGAPDGWVSWNEILENQFGGREPRYGFGQTTLQNGFLMLFRTPPGVKIPATLAPGIDLKSSGYFCTGSGYIPAEKHGYDQLAALPPFPQELISYLAAQRTPQRRRQLLPTAPSGGDLQRSAANMTESCLRRLVEFGGRNRAGFALAGQLRDLGLGVGEAEGWMDVFRTRCAAGNHEYTREEALASLKSAYNGARRDPPQGENYTPKGESPRAPEPAHNGAAAPQGEDYSEVIEDLHSPAQLAENLQPPDEPPNEGSLTPPVVKRQTVWTVSDLLGTVFPEPKWAIPGLVPVGLSFLAGRPKLGKSWLALQFAHAVGTGGRALGEVVQKGKVLYLALEDSPRRLKARAEKQGIPRTADIVFRTEWKPFSGGGLAELMTEINGGGYSFVVIDTISRALGKADQLDLTEMTTIMGNLQYLALARDISILLIDHHTKPKGFEGDPIDDIMGSTGKAAVSDVGIGLYKTPGKKGATLKARGRDMEDKELALDWDGLTCSWQNLGNAGDVRQDTLKGDILQAIRDLKEDGDLATTTNISKRIGRDAGNINHALADLVTAGKVKRGTPQGKARPYEVV